jgi:hypothetical protein
MLLYLFEHLQDSVIKPDRPAVGNLVYVLQWTCCGAVARWDLYTSAIALAMRIYKWILPQDLLLEFGYHC